jgi:hypothetical protein
MYVCIFYHSKEYNIEALTQMFGVVVTVFI